jgi:hypothetical protein
MGLVAGITIGFAAKPKTVLAAHVIGITTGLAAIGVAIALSRARLSDGALRLVAWTLLPSLYLGFLTQWIGGLFGLSRMFIVTAAGQPEGAQWLETVVEYTIKGITPLTILPFLVLLYGLIRGMRGSDPMPATV